MIIGISVILILIGLVPQSCIIFITADQGKSSIFKQEHLGESSRQCECWIWPSCVSNCTNPIVKTIFESEHEKIAKLKLPFIVLFPYQARKQKQRKIDTSTLNKQGNYRMEANFWVHLVNGKDLQLSLRKSKIFGDESKTPNNHVLKYYQKSNEVLSDKFKKCFYTGTVLLDQSETIVSHSYVSVDTCDGLRGIILYQGFVYGIIPMKHAKAPANGPLTHFIYPETATIIERNAENLKTFWHVNSVMNDKVIGSENVLYTVSTSLVIDHTLMKLLNNDIETATHFAVSLVNFITKSFMSLKQIQIELSKVELWNMGDKCNISNSIKTTLGNFLNYRLKSVEGNSNKRNAEFVILISGVKFYEDVEYLSIPDSVCTQRSVSVVQVTAIDQVYQVSRLMSLAIAENFGIKSFLCPDNYDCISKIVLSKGDESRLKLTLLSGQANCLKEEHSTMEVLNTCGNGRLDRGEECDTNNEMESSRLLNCCDNNTCLVANYAQCNGGECCSTNCTFLSRGRYCRPSRDHCDIPEFCSGDSGNCPKDLFLENGQPCNKGTALCYQGRCPTRDNKCQGLWGAKSKEADKNCYSTFNKKYEDSCGLHRKCTEENQMCGYLFCQGGSDSLNESDIKSESKDKIRLSIITSLQNQEKQIKCKYLDNHEHSYVEDGTECGKGKYCFGNTCTLGNSKIISKCPKMVKEENSSDSLVCYNRGLCTNVEKCLCHPGWMGENCSLPINGSFSINGEFGYSEQVKNYIWAYFKEIGIYDGPIFLSDNESGGNLNDGPGKSKSIETVNLIIILGSCIGIIFIILVLFMICYRRTNDYRSKRSDSYGSNGLKGGGSYKAQDKFDSVGYEYHTESGVRIVGRKSNLSMGSKRISDGRYDSDISGSNKRRGRRHRRRTSNGSGHRQLCRDTGDGNESTGAISESGGNEQDWNRSRPGGASSNNEINNLSVVGKVSEEIGNSIEKNIKFGSMPSYKEDKLNRSISNSPPSYSVINNSPQETDSSVLCRSSDPLLTNVSSPCNSEVQSLLRSSTNSYPVSQAYPSLSISTSFPSSPPLISSPEKKDLAMLNAKLFSGPFGLPAPALFPNVPYTSCGISNIASSVISQDKSFDIVFKQPEKGILKNKSSGDLKEISHNVQPAKDYKNHHSCSSKKHKQKEHKKRNDSNSVTTPSSGSQSSLSSYESNLSSCSVSSSSSSSCSSPLSSLVTPPRKIKHSHKQKSSNRRSQNNPLPAPPTILCNASNQTEDLDPKVVLSTNTIGAMPNSQLHLMSNGEEYMEDCDEEDCEECMKVRSGHVNKTPPETLITSNSSAYDIVGSTDDGYQHYHSSNLRFNPDLSVHYDCHMMPATNQRLPTNEEQCEQSSETEVDSHLQVLLSQPSHFYPVGGINKFLPPVQFGENPISKESNRIHIPSMQSNQYQQYNNINNKPYYYSPPPPHPSVSMTSANIFHSPTETDDMISEPSLSSYYRVSLPANSNLVKEQVSRLNVPTTGTGSDRFSSTCFDGASNDGTIEGSDTSSLPDAHCDLLNLAQLGIGSSRPNPMLNNLVRGQNQSRKMHDANDSCASSMSPLPMWSSARNDNRSPGHLPNPKDYSSGSDFLA